MTVNVLSVAEDLTNIWKDPTSGSSPPSAVPAAPAVSALVGRAPESSPWFVRRRGVIIDVPEGAAAGSRAIVSLPDDGSARQATVTIAFPPGLSTGQELTVALEV